MPNGLLDLSFRPSLDSKKILGEYVVTFSKFVAIAGGVLGTLGGVVIVLYAAGFVSALECWGWMGRTVMSPRFETAMILPKGVAIYLVGLFVAQVGIVSTAGRAIATSATKFIVLAGGIALLVGGVILFKGMVSGWELDAELDSTSHEARLQTFNRTIEGLSQFLRIGTIFVAAAPVILAIASFFNSDDPRRPSKPLMDLSILTAILLLACVVGLIFCYLTWQRLTTLAEKYAQGKWLLDPLASLRREYLWSNLFSLLSLFVAGLVVTLSYAGISTEPAVSGQQPQNEAAA